MRSRLTAFCLWQMALFCWAEEAKSLGANADLHKTPKSGVAYYLSLPEGWNDKDSWPILVSVDGSSHDFAGNFRGFVEARGHQPFIIVTPLVASDGGDPNDLEAILEIVHEVQTAHHGQPKFFMTGFSAGGHATWQVIFSHPELLAGAVLCAPTFKHHDAAEISKDPAVKTLSIHGIQGDKDKYLLPMLAKQWDQAVSEVTAAGFQPPTREVVPGAEHQPFCAKTIEWCAAHLPH
jgi:predicted esterase